MNLRVVGASLVVSLKIFYREKTTMFFTIAFPIMLILVFGSIFTDQDNMNFDLCVQDLDQTETSAEIVKSPGPLREIQDNQGRSRHRRRAVRQGQQARTLSSLSPKTMKDLTYGIWN